MTDSAYTRNPIGHFLVSFWITLSILLYLPVGIVECLIRGNRGMNHYGHLIEATIFWLSYVYFWRKNFNE